MAELIKRVARDAVTRLGLKAPWKITGPLASSEWMSQDSMASEYRSKSPMKHGQEQSAQVPWADTDKIYDIKYYTRDYRHAGTVGGLNMSKTRVVRYELSGNGEDIPGGADLDSPVPTFFGTPGSSLHTRSDMAPSGYTDDIADGMQAK